MITSDKNRLLNDFHALFEKEYISKLMDFFESHQGEIKDKLGEDALLSQDQRLQAYKLEMEELMKRMKREIERVDEANETFERNKTRILSNGELNKFNSEIDLYNNKRKPLLAPSEGERTIKDLLEISDYILYCYYLVAYHLSSENLHKEASNIFLFLSMLNPYVQDYWLGLGICEKMNDNNQKALSAFAMAALMNEADPVPHLNSAQCYLQNNDFENAQIELEEAKANDFEDEAWQPVINNLQEKINNIKTLQHQ